MSFHIGKLIKKQIKEKGWSLKKFAEEANMTYRNALYLFDRTDVSIDQLQHVGKVLSFDFVSLYGRKNTEEPVKNIERIETVKTENMPVLAYKFGIPAESYGNIKAFQDEIQALVIKYGMLDLT